MIMTFRSKSKSTGGEKYLYLDTECQMKFLVSH